MHLQLQTSTPPERASERSHLVSVLSPPRSLFPIEYAIKQRVACLYMAIDMLACGARESMQQSNEIFRFGEKVYGCVLALLLTAI